MDVDKVWKLLQAHEKSLGLPQFNNIRRALEEELQEMHNDLSVPKPKPIPAYPPIPSAPKSIPAVRRLSGGDNGSDS